MTVLPHVVDEQPGGPAPAGGSAEHRTVGRVMAILELVVASSAQGVRLNDLATALAAPKSSVHALAKGLLATGYLREDTGRYVVGPAISSLIALGKPTPHIAFRHLLTQLAARWDETAMLATLVGDSIVYLDSVEPEVFIRASPALNKRLPLWPRSSGKVFLALMEPKRLDAYLRRRHRDPAEIAAIRAELDRTRELGFGLSVGESVAGHIAISVPIVRSATPATTAIAIAGPKSRLQDRIAEIAYSINELIPTASR